MINVVWQWKSTACCRRFGPSRRVIEMFSLYLDIYIITVVIFDHRYMSDQCNLFQTVQITHVFQWQAWSWGWPKAVWTSLCYSSSWYCLLHWWLQQIQSWPCGRADIYQPVYNNIPLVFKSTFLGNATSRTHGSIHESTECALDIIPQLDVLPPMKCLCLFL